MSLWWLVLIPVVVALIILERRRQARKLGGDHGKRGTAGHVMGAGMLELQQMLQPDRNVETIRQEMTDRDRQHPEYRVGEEGDDVGDEPDASR
jgi:hypothetical protein